MKRQIRSFTCVILMLSLILWQATQNCYGQAGIPEPTTPTSPTLPGGNFPGGTLPGSSTVTNWLRLNGDVGINTSNPKARLHVAGGDVYVENIGSGVILRSPNGYCWRVTVDNSGNFVRTQIACPGAPPLAANVLNLQPGSNEGQDGYTSSFSTTSVNGGPGMATGSWTTNNGNPVVYQSYLRFNLSELPTTARIDSAFLSLTYQQGWFSEPNVGNNPIYIQRVTGNWDQTTLSYNSRPTSTTVGQIAVASAESFPGVYRRLNVKSLIAEMVANPATNFGFMFRLQDEAPAPPYRNLLFSTSEHPTSGNRPKLVVYYSF